MQQQRALFLYLFFTQQRLQTDQGSYGRCDNEDGELPHWCDRGNQGTRTSKDRDGV